VFVGPRSGRKIRGNPDRTTDLVEAVLVLIQTVEIRVGKAHSSLPGVVRGSHFGAASSSATRRRTNSI
jgi:hypothetical protein